MPNTFQHRVVFLLALCAILVISPVSSITLSPGNSFDGAPTIANGDPVFIRGIATGHPQNGLQIWVIGKNYVKISSVPVNEDNTYEFELKSADTRTLAPGQYFVLVQHPMMNAEFDIDYNSATGGVINRQLGAGTSIFQLTGAGGLQSTDSAYALMQAINSQNIDDTFAITSFIVGNPTATINPIGDHYVGDTFSINGSTNLAAGNDLLIEIYSSSFNPTQKIQGSGFSGSSAVVKVEPGTNGINRWSYPVDASAFKPDEYLVKVSGITNDVTVSATFNILAALPPASPSTVTTTPTELRTASPVTQTPSPMPTTTNQSPLSPITILIGLGLVGWATILKRK